jgi:integron integrase
MVRDSLSKKEQAIMGGIATTSLDSAARPGRLLDRIRHAARLRHLATSTEKAYVHWAKRFVLFHGRRHPQDMAEPEVNAFLTHLAVHEHVAASTQNQALAALLFLYAKVLGRPLERMEGIVRAKRPKRLPAVLTPDEVRRVLECMTGEHWLVAMLLYGAGLRLLEALRLRVKDIDMTHNVLTIREAKGNKDRVTVLPSCLRDPLGRHLQHRRRQHVAEVEAGRGRVMLPKAFARKHPNAELDWAWQWVFTGKSDFRDRETSHPRDGDSAGGSRGSDPRGSRAAGDLPYAATLVRDPSPPGWGRHPHGAGSPGPQRREDDDDLHARAQPRRRVCSQPGGPIGAGAMTAATAARGAEASRVAFRTAVSGGCGPHPQQLAHLAFAQPAKGDYPADKTRNAATRCLALRRKSCRGKMIVAARRSGRRALSSGNRVYTEP